MIVSYLIKKGIIRVVPISDTFFHTVSFTSSKKLSHESVLFNYQKFSPYKNSAVSYMQQDKKMLLWFYDSKYDSMLTVPEGYLYYQYFLKTKQDNLVSVKNKTHLVIKDKILQYQSSFISSSEHERALLAKKYHIKKVIEKSDVWDIKNRKKVQNQSLLSIIKHFLNRKMFLDKLKKRLSLLILPSLIFVTLLSAAHFGIGQYLQKELTKLTEQKKQLKKQTKDMFDNYTKNRQDILFFKKHFQKHNQKIASVLEEVSYIVDKEGIKLYYVEFDNYYLTIRAEADNIEVFLEKLANIKLIETFKLKRQTKLKNGKKGIIIEITLRKEKQNDEQ